jgi:hypothetical protein
MSELESLGTSLMVTEVTGEAIIMAGDKTTIGLSAFGAKPGSIKITGR